ncbi:MAG: site-specific integrase [Acetobacteraceae bacterium]|nr:site-specific integrase [Acetobacteraceae bacterium]
MTRLRQRMIEDMQLRHLSPHTQRAYLTHVARFAQLFHRSPDLLGPPEIRSYQLYLTRDRQFSPSSIGVANSALRFLYKVTLKREWNLDDAIPTGGRQPRTLPVVPSPEEVARFLDAVPSLQHRVILTVCYAAGLRISEAVRLKPTAIDSQRMVIRVEQGKGRKDRYVMLSLKLLEVLRDHWRRTRPKQWLFPGDVPGQPISAGAVEVACHIVRDQIGIGKPITPHSLRHAFAVHMLEGGTDVRTIQLLLGHRSLNTTARYLCLATNKVCAAISPFEGLQPPSSAVMEAVPTPA